jgi:serine/threonine protein kinase
MISALASFNLVVLEKQLATSHLTEVINEAICMNILTHPNIPQLLDVKITTKPHSLIMQFIGEDIKSSTVHQLLQDSNAQRSPLSLAEWISVCIDIVEGVKHLQSKGYLHCDLKTNNVLVFKQRGFVIDFGKVCLATKPCARKYTSFYHYIARRYCMESQ